MASIVGVVIYQKALKNYPFRNLIFAAQLLYGLSGMLDIIFILRWNLVLGIPDSFFVISEECVSRIVSRVRWMPMIVLSTRLCPLGIEGTFFALLMCIDSLGSLSSKWGGRNCSSFVKCYKDWLQKLVVSHPYKKCSEAWDSEFNFSYP